MALENITIKLKQGGLNKLYDVYPRGWGTIEIQKKNINKYSALSFYLKSEGLTKKMCYFLEMNFMKAEMINHFC